MESSLTFGEKNSQFKGILSSVAIFIFPIIALIIILPQLWWATIVIDNSIEIKFIILFISLLFTTLTVFLILFIKRSAFFVSKYYPVEINSNSIAFLINFPKRIILNIVLIKKPRLFCHWIFFKYKGWPLFIPLGLNKKDRLKLLSTIKLANKKRNNMDGSFEPPIR